MIKALFRRKCLSSSRAKFLADLHDRRDEYE